MTAPRAVVAVLAALLLTAAACGDDGGTSTTAPSGTVDPGDVVFGEGELPEAFPQDFPVPGDAIIGTTLVTPTRVEVAMVVRQDLDELVASFEAGLVAAGYDLGGSQALQAGWKIDFTEPGTDGNIVLTRQAAEITQLVVQLDEA